MAGLSDLTASMGTNFRWTAQNNLQGGVYQPIQNSGNLTSTENLGTAAGNTAVGGADEVFSFQQSIAGGGNATLDLTAMTNLLAQAGVDIARIKAVQFRLLSAADDPTITPAPNAASTCTVTNNGPTCPSPMDFNNGGTGLTVTLTVGGGGAVTGVAIASAGSGYPPSSVFAVSPQQVGGNGCMLCVITNGSGIPTNVVFIVGAGGQGYSNGVVPVTPVGQYTLLTGGAHMYIDPSATGFTLVSSLSRNLRFYNNDPVNAITVEVDFIACTT